jgi:NADPH:quinone reductase-like Zn-dependent oxidoreductase
MSTTIAKAAFSGLTSLASGARPVIARTFPFEEIVETHRFLKASQQLGKIVVKL